MMLRVVLKWFAQMGLIFRIRGSQVLGAWKVGGLKVGTAVCWWAIFTQHGKRIAGYCAGIGALEWAREGRLRVPGALRGALCALLATWCVLVEDDMA